VFFTSNNLELSVLEHESKNEIFANQEQAIDSLFQIFGALGWNLYLRLHPTLEKYPSSSGAAQPWAKICKKYNAILVDGSSSVDSFALAHGSKVAAHFNSSIGPQLIYENHPGVITLGPTFWMSLAPSSHVSNKDRLFSYAQDQIWKQKLYLSSDILPWAFYRATRGKNFKFVKYDPETARWDIPE
jgi:hypothetical protein